MILCWIQKKNAEWTHKYIITNIKFTKAPDVDDEKCAKCKFQSIGHPMIQIDKNTYEKLCTLEVLNCELFDYNKLEFFRLRRKDLL